MTSQQFLDKIIIQLRHYREAHRLSQTQMAQILNIGLRSFQRYESGESMPPLDFIYNVCQLFNVKLSHLLNPNEHLDRLPHFRIYPQEQLVEFESHPLVVGSGILSIIDCKVFQKFIDSGNLMKLKSIKEFMDSPFMLTVATPKSSFVNRYTLERSGLILPSSQLCQANSDDITRVGIIWACLIEKGNCYFSNITHTHLPIGPARISGKYIFRKHGGQYFKLGVVEFKSQL